MEVTYKIDGNQNFIIIKYDGSEKYSYMLQMIINNKIEGILPLRIKKINNTDQFYYNITSKISMESAFARKKMSYEDIKKFVLDLEYTMENLREYLLDSDKLVLDFPYIFMDVKSKRYNFCYYPENNIITNEGIKGVFMQILENLDHEDKMAIVLGYGLGQICERENFTVLELAEFVRETQSEEREKAKEQNEYTVNEVFETQKNEDRHVSESLKGQNIKLNRNKHGKRKKLNWLARLFNRKFKSEEQLLLEKDFDLNNNINKAKCEVDYNSKIRLDSDIIMEKINEKNIETDENTVLLIKNISGVSLTLRSLDEEKTLSIVPDKFPYIIGKSKRSSDYQLDNVAVSRVHVRINEEVDGYLIEDLNSTNGTFVNENQLEPHTPERINIGDKITLADTEFIIE